jgi:hypothetical protein
MVKEKEKEEEEEKETEMEDNLRRLFLCQDQKSGDQLFRLRANAGY